MSGAILFGKLPPHGDFVMRGMSSKEEQFWDAGLSEAMALATAHFGASFDALYVRAAPWRCVTAVGDDYFAGALAPSVDKTGRPFPILVGRMDGERLGGGVVAESCEALLFDALANGWDADTLFQNIAALPLAARAEVISERDGWWLDGHELLARPVEPLPGLMPPTLLCEMLAVAEQFA